MITTKEILNTWRRIRPDLANLINFIDGKEESLQNLDAAYERGFNNGRATTEADITIAYQRGLEEAWEAARKIFAIYSAQEAIEKLREYEEKKEQDAEIAWWYDGNTKKAKTNKDKFKEVFPDITPAMIDSVWWDEPYEEAGNEL